MLISEYQQGKTNIIVGFRHPTSRKNSIIQLIQQFKQFLTRYDLVVSKQVKHLEQNG